MLNMLAGNSDSMRLFKKEGSKCNTLVHHTEITNNSDLKKTTNQCILNVSMLRDVFYVLITFICYEFQLSIYENNSQIVVC